MIRRMGTVIVSLAALMLCLSAFSGKAVAGAVDVVIFCDDSYPPYSYAEGGAAKGAYAEVLRTAFSRMDGFKVTIKPAPWKSILKDIEAGDAFAFYPPYYRPKDRPYVDPVSVPVLDEVVRPICRKEVMTKKERVKWPEDFYGLKFSHNAGFAVNPAFEKAAKEKKITVEEAHTTEENLLKLAQGAVDCYVNSDLSINKTLKALKSKGLLVSTEDFEFGPSASKEAGYVGFAKNNKKFPFRDQFVKQLNEVLTKMKAAGEIDTLAKKGAE